MTVLTGADPIFRPGPITQRYGLFQAVPVNPEVTPLDGSAGTTWRPHWADGGLVIDDELCDDPNPYTVACTADLAAKTFTTTNSVPGTPFVVYAGIVCGSVGYSEAEFQAKVTNRLLAGEQGVVEAVFSRQLNGQSRGLANATPNATTITATSTTGGHLVADQVGALEEALYSTYGPRGVLHVPFQYGERMKAENIIEPDGNVFAGSGVWRTALGTAVSIGNYEGYSPAGVAPVAGHTWIYITGQAWVWRNPDVFVSTLQGSLNQTTNQVTFLAEREYIVTYECGAFALDVTY